MSDTKPKNAWLHRANDNYYTDEQTCEPGFPLSRETLERAYIPFIEKSAYDKLAAELAREKEYSAETHARFEEQSERISELTQALAAAEKVREELELEQVRHIDILVEQYEAKLQAERERAEFENKRRNETVEMCSRMERECDAAWAEVERLKGNLKEHLESGEKVWNRMNAYRQALERLTRSKHDDVSAIAREALEKK